MAIFVKLPNGEIVNSLYINLIKKHGHAAMEEIIKARVRARQDGSSPEQHLNSIPSIQVFCNGESNPILLKFDSVELRDAEFDRMEVILLPKPQVLFKDLLLVPETIQALQVGWSNVMQTTLKLDIRASGDTSYQVFVRRDDKAEWDRAEQLVAHFGLSMPRTHRELMDDMYDEGGNLKSKETF